MTSDIRVTAKSNTADILAEIARLRSTDDTTVEQIQIDELVTVLEQRGVSVPAALARDLLARHDLTLEMSRDDASWASDRAVPRAEARAIVDELAAAGIEASDAPDAADRSLAWVHVAGV